MISNEEIKSCIEEWFNERTTVEGITGLVQVYATIKSEIDRQLLLYQIECDKEDAE